MRAAFTCFPPDATRYKSSPSVVVALQVDSPARHWQGTNLQFFQPDPQVLIVGDKSIGVCISFAPLKKKSHNIWTVIVAAVSDWRPRSRYHIIGTYYSACDRCGTLYVMYTRWFISRKTIIISKTTDVFKNSFFFLHNWKSLQNNVFEKRQYFFTFFFFIIF